ncbi:AsnB, Asparagine synthase (glutamine-hydrolyzing) [Teratosphaeria destructans]|uniref:AsnB, Asparagine synthase (Glutamine-hydrolyzing) n=1 Tax=Teratosphaeria destructans TaxID=418781 RepID=A0A9W7T1F2_9PEZI|nr:AsnB, Asparagine synthase (glutamine-hydrolyzing) [Teratosphaeria destructans]
MCGIFCAIGREAPLKPSPELQKLLQQRGPDSHGKREDSIKGQQDNSTPLYVTFYSTVLSMRGDAAIIQPYQDGLSASTLCWNGEAWSIATVATHGNDTEQIFNLLSHACQHPVDATSREIEARMRLDTISKALSTIAGPYAFVFHDARSQMLFFGRDFLGRRSLLLKVTEGGDVLISSVTDPSSSNAWAEVEADDVYSLDLLASTVHPSLVIYQTSHVFHEDGVSTQSSVGLDIA